MSKVAAFSAAVFCTMFSAQSFAACNMGEDAKNITQLNFGKLKLAGISPGDLRVTGQHALPDKDSWPFVLRVKNNQIDLSVSGVNTSSSAPLKFEATMQMTRPITGFILERMTPSGCNREIRIQDGDLNGNTIRFKNGTVNNSFGGTIPLAGLEWKVQRQEDVSDLRGRASGKIRLAGPKIKIVGAQVRLPGQGKLPVTTNLTSAQNGNISLDLALGTLGATIRSATLLTDSLSFAASSFPDNWNNVFLAGEGGAAVQVEDLKLVTASGDTTQISFRIAGLRPVELKDQSKDPTAQKIIGCYVNETTPTKIPTIQQIYDCSGVWVTPRVLLSCALEAHCSWLPDTREGRNTLDAMLQTESLTRESPLSLPTDPLHLPPLPSKDKIDQCRAQAGSKEAFESCVNTSVGQRFEKVRACFTRATEGERLACFAEFSQDNSFKVMVGCMAGGKPTPEKLATCITPKQEMSKIDGLRQCILSAGTEDIARSCLTKDLGNVDREVAECVSSHKGLEVATCFEKLAPGISKASDVVQCVTKGSSPAPLTQCVAPIVGGDAGKIATCVANADKKAAIICLLGDKPEVRQALQVYNCASGGRDAKSIISNCSDGLIKDQKTRETLACVSQSSGDRAQLVSCAAGAALPPDAAHLVGCATSSQGPTSFALCAAGPAMNEEWRIAAECAVQSGGNPVGFAGCTAGRLTARELTKCFTGEFGKDCFGPENTLVKGVTNAFNDLTRGPGENNEIVKGIKAIGEVTGGPNSVVRNPKQLLGGPNSVFNNPSQIWGGPNSVFNNPGQIWGGPGSVFNDPGQVLDPSRWRF
ncbi:hypothetical protein ACRQ5Q_09055 [Bradyrhizobium sp. PMVTL-01]|uniref:hypothetical protein n=1 Tax=Bradyrhizobium sp. PMVTL-01 TaxID=3434999 RepID=UPI003F7062AD